MLIVSGPYRFLRHPMYTALLLITGALVLDTFSQLRLAAWLVFFFDLIFKTRLEERFLEKRFRNFKHYARYTYKLIPFIY